MVDKNSKTVNLVLKEVRLAIKGLHKLARAVTAVLQDLTSCDRKKYKSNVTAFSNLLKEIRQEYPKMLLS